MFYEISMRIYRCSFCHLILHSNNKPLNYVILKITVAKDSCVYLI